MSIYKPEIFYPVHIGEVFKERYQVVAKLGFGSRSTTWLCHDLHHRRYVALKMHVNTIKVNQELQILELLRNVDSNHLGQNNIRTIYDSFEIEGPHGTHSAFIQPPLGASLRDLQNAVAGNVFQQHFVQAALGQVLPALDFLHRITNVAHTDVQTANLLIGVKDATSFAKLENAELKNPVPRKQVGGRTIYMSRALMSEPGPLFLCDFGEARIGNEQHGTAMPTPYRAPEVILDMDWGHSVDMWAVALVTWDLLMHKSLFKVHHIHNQELNDACHLADMIALIGPPPLTFLKRSKNYLKFWDEDGNWRDIVPIPTERTIESLQPPENSQGSDLLDFLMALLRWAPEQRLTAKQATAHRWLCD